MPFPTPEDLHNPGIEPMSLVSPVLTSIFLSIWNSFMGTLANTHINSYSPSILSVSKTLLTEGLLGSAAVAA